MEGKKQYDREFLLLLRKDPLSSERPPNLPNMDIVKDKAVTRNLQFPGGKQADFLPSYVKATPSKVINFCLFPVLL